MIRGIDVRLHPAEMLKLSNVAVSVFGITTSLYLLAQDDWICRIKQNIRNQSRMSIHFCKGSQVIRFILPTQRYLGVQETLDLLPNLEQVSHLNIRTYSKFINRCSDSELLDELNRRNPVKKKKKVAPPKVSNIVKLEEYMRKFVCDDVDEMNVG